MSQETTQDLTQPQVVIGVDLQGPPEDDTECIAILEYEGKDADDRERLGGYNFDFFLFFSLSFPDSSLEIPLYPGEEIRIGRESHPQPPTSRRTFQNYVIKDGRVSKKHFRIYSIVYEQNKSHDTQTPGLPPLVYCEDLESSNGTYVNGRLIGIIGKEKVAHLLCNGDVVEIRPTWKFIFHQSNHHMIFPTITQSKDMEVCLLLPWRESPLTFLSTSLTGTLSPIEYLGLVTMGMCIWERSCLPTSRLHVRLLTWTRPLGICRNPTVTSAPLVLAGSLEWILLEGKRVELCWRLRFSQN